MSIKCIKSCYNDAVYQAECDDCKSVFEAMSDDLSISFSRNEEVIQSICCPKCGTYGLNFKKVLNKGK